MKKKQLFAILLAGTIAAGGAPAAAFASAEAVSENANSASESTDSAGTAGTDSAGTADDTNGASGTDESTGSGEATETPAAETPAAEPTATTAPAEPTATTAPTQSAAAETPAEPTAAPTETPATPTAEPSATPVVSETPADDAAATNTGIAIYTTTDDDTETATFYETLQDAVDAAVNYQKPEGEEDSSITIVLTKDVELSEGIEIKDGNKIAIMAQSTVSVKRAAGFVEDMFTVSGEDSELQLGVKDNGVLTVTGAAGADTDTVTGSIISVGSGASFGILDGATLTENDTTADGAAVENDGGTVYLLGGTITDNAGAKGAVYSNTEINAKGAVNVSDNYQYEDGARTETEANLYLDNSSDTSESVTDIKISGDMTGSKIGITLASPADGTQVLCLGEKVEQTVLEAAAELVSYDTEDYTVTLSDDGTTAVLKKAETPEPGAFLTYSTTGEAWSDFTTFTTGTFTVSKDCSYYYTTVAADSSDETIQNTLDTSKATTKATANSTFTVTAEDIPETTPWLVVWAVPSDGSDAEYQVIKLNEGTLNKNRPFISISGLSWSSHIYLKISLDSERSFNYKDKATWVDASDTAVEKVTEPTEYSGSAGPGEVSLKVKTIKDSKDYGSGDNWMVFWVKSSAGEVSKLVVKPSEASNSRPAAATPTPTTKPSTVTQSGTPSWQDHTTLKVNFKNSGEVSYYYEIVDSSSSGTWDASKATTSVSSSTTLFSSTVTDIPDDNTKKIIFWFKLNSSGEHKKITINLSDLESSRPDATTVTTRAAKTYSVSESTVTWADGSAMTTGKKFYPKYFYPFTVTGAGTDNESPVTGDERWVPQYWTMSTQSGAQQHTSWKIGSTNGIQDAASYNMYVYFKKQRYNGKEWVDTGEVEYKTVTFRSAGYTDDEYSEFLKNLDPDDENYTGSYTEVAAELTATEAAVESSVTATTTAAASSSSDSSSTKSAASTADESPIGSMATLAMLSALAGGYILVRKRKREF